MKTIPVLLSKSVRRAGSAAALTIAVFGAVLLGGVSVQAGTTNYYWNNTSSDFYTNDADWVGGVAPLGLQPGQLAPGGSANYAVYVTNSGAITYGDGGGGNSSGYTWTNVLGNLFLGWTNGNGTFNMNSDSLTISNVAGSAFELSVVTNSSGTFNMTGGTLNVIRDALTLYQDSALIGVSPNNVGTGTFTISGGVANFLCGVEIAEAGGAGIFNVNGGVVVDNGWFGVRGGSAGSSGGAFNLTAGTVYILRNSGNDGASDGGVQLCQTGSNGVVNISGGALYCTKIAMGGSAGIKTNTTLNISGGSIYIGYLGVLSNGPSADSVNISGGAFHTADMLQISTGTNAGATNTILSDGTNWTWTAFPSVNLTNSSFLVNGSSGPGYVTFAPEAGRTITLSNTWSGVGGFLVNGPGTVNAGSGLQNVNGGITVSNGTLALSGTITNNSALFASTNSTLYVGPNTAAAGILTAKNVTLEGPGATLEVPVSTSTNGLLVVTNLTLDPANSVLNVIPLAVPSIGSTFVVAEYSGTLSGTFSVVTNYLGYVFTVSYATPHEITVTYVNAGEYYNWISTSPADWSVANDWDMLNVPNSVNDVVLLTNGVECDYSSSDNYSIGQLSIAPWDSSSGSLVMGGGSLYISNSINYYDVTIGGRSGASGVGGNGETPQTPSLGQGGTASLTMNNGTMTVIRLGTGFYHQDAFMVGLGTNTTGTFTINNGTLNALCGIEIGLYGNGIFNINGGSVIDNGWFGVGRGNGVPFGTGVFNITGGTLYQLENGGGGTVGAGASAGLCLNQGCTNAMVNISGGTVYSGDIAFSGPNVTPTPVDALNISGGALYIGSFGIYTNSETLVPICNISGGTFHTVDMLLSGGAGGANGAITNILSDGTNWTWKPEPAVNLTNNSFMVNGTAGPGYVTFAPEATRTITLNNIWSGVGGLTLNGPGNLALGAANTYSGGTTVSQGNLILNAGGGVPDSSITFPSGSTLVFNEGSAVSFTNIVTGPGNVLVNNSSTTVNVAKNLQNSGAIVISNGALVVNGTILNSSGVTNASTTGPLVAQGTILSPIAINTNAAFAVGNTALPGTLNASNVTVNGTWNFKINTPTTVGNGSNDLLVCSNLVLNPGSSVLSITPQTPPSVGTYVIAEYVSLNGQFGTLTNATRDGMSLNYVPASGNTLGEVQLILSSSNTANLVWSATNLQANINWDVNTSSNWTNTATSALDTFHQQDAVAFNAVPGTGVTNRVSVTGQVMPQSINISGGLPYLFSGSGYLSGGTGLNYNDTNVSGIYTAGNNYTGPVNINNGILQLGSGGSSWLGTSNTTTISGGTLDLDAQGVGSEPLVIQGSGAAISGTNGGAINNSATTSPGQSAGPLNVTLAGNTTLNATGNRWDIGVATLGAGGGSFAGNGYTLTKIGNQAIWMHEVGDTGLGNIVISNGLLGFQYTIGMGIPSDTVTVESNATMGIYQLQTNSLLNKQMVLNGSATLQSGGGTGSSNNFIGPITLNGTNTITTSVYPLNLGGNITGTGGFIVSGTGPLYLGGNNTYSGSTVLAAGGSSIILEPGASIPDTSLIYLTPSTNTALGTAGGIGGGGTITLNSGQTLEGSGSINASNFVAGPGSAISLGTNQSVTAYGTILFTNNLTLNGNTNYLKISDFSQAGVDNDLIQVQNNLTLSGNSTLVVTPTAALIAGNPYPVMEDINNNISGSVNNLTVISTSPRYTMTPEIETDPNGYNAVELNITGNAAPLEWKGYLTPNWDLVTSNWYNMGTAVHDHFYNGDNPTFDDTATVTSVALTNNVLVAGVNMSNVVNTYTFTGGGVINGPLNMEGNGNGHGGTLVLALSNAPVFTTIDSSAGTVVFDVQGVSNYVVAANISDNLGSGSGNVVFGGTNIVTLEGNNAYDSFADHPAFYGALWVTNGVLEYTNVDALGADASVSGSPSFAPLILTNTGTLNFNGVAIGAADGAGIGGEKWIHISGTGYQGEGALTDSKNNQEPSGAFCNLYLDANATIGCQTNTRCDQHVLSGNAQQVEGNGFNITFVGEGSFFFYAQSDGDTHFGNIDAASTLPGRLAFQGGPLALGVPTSYLFVESNAEVTFYAVSNQFDTVHAGINKIMWLKGDASVDSGGNNIEQSNNFVGPVFLTGTNLFGTREALYLWNSVMDSNGPGGFVLGNDSVGASGGNLWLEGTNSYSGPTIVSNETVSVGANSSLGMSTYVQVNSGATLDLSATPGYNFGTILTNQTLSGNGTVIAPSAGLYFNPGGTLAVGLPSTNGLANTNTYTLAISNTVAFNSGSIDYIVANKTSPSAGSVPVDEVSGMTSLTLGGTLVITNFGTSFVANDSLKLFNSAGYGSTNGLNIIPATPGPNLAWNINSLPINGTLGVVSTLTVNPNPTNIVFSVTGRNLTLAWPLDHTGWQLQVQTNSLAVGIKTNWVNVSGSTTTNQVVVPINLTNGCVFYRLTY